MNIPTELLRTLVAVVDQRSFTKAAQTLGITQPAVSAQIKRLQAMLSEDLFDRRAPGVSLTPSGRMVVTYARRLLSINDEIVSLAGPTRASRVLRIGTTADFATPEIGRSLARFRAGRPDVRFVVSSMTLDALSRDLSEGNLDVAVWMSALPPPGQPRHGWEDDMVWVCSSSLAPPSRGLPLPLVSYAEGCPFTRDAVAALTAAEIEHELVLMMSSIGGLIAAVSAGVGVTALPRGRVAGVPGVAVWSDSGLPPLARISCGVAVREGHDSADRESLAQSLAETLRGETLDARTETVDALLTGTAI